MSVYVGIDVHRKRSQVAVIDEGGEVLANRNVPNGVQPVLGVIGGLPPGTPAAFEAAFGWGWLVELLEDCGFAQHLVHPLQRKAIASARLKNDKVDAAILAQLLRADLLPEAWIAPPQVRQLRALLRHRIQLVRQRTLLRNRIHAVLADHGHDRPGGCWSGPGRTWLASLPLPTVSREVIEDDLALIDVLQVPIDRLDREVQQHARRDPRVKVLTQLPGVGPFTALVLLAEIGEVSRFGSARKLPAVSGGDRRVRPVFGVLVSCLLMAPRWHARQLASVAPRWRTNEPNGIATKTSSSPDVPVNRENTSVVQRLRSTDAPAGAAAPGRAGVAVDRSTPGMP